MGGEKGAANAAAFFVVACCISTKKYKDTPRREAHGEESNSNSREHRVGGVV